MAVACGGWGLPRLAALISFVLLTTVSLNPACCALAARRLGCPSVELIRLERSEESDVFVENGVVTGYEGKEVELLVIGSGFSNNTRIALTTESKSINGQCVLGVLSVEYSLKLVDVDFNRTVSLGRLTLTLPSKHDGKDIFYLCVADSSQNCSNLAHQGDSWFQIIAVKSKLLPIWLRVIILVLLLTLSALFSGLNLGLMSLDLTELKIIQSCGTESEKKFAKAIAPVRKRGNYLLCTLLLGNVLVNSTIAIFLDDLGGGVIAVVSSTLCIVTFGEIIPQALCSRHGLAIGARTILITRFFMILTFPLSFPLSKVLDLILGQEFGQVYNREKLQELVKLADRQDIKKEEINIIQGALLLTKKIAADVMNPIDDVFMVEHQAVLDYNTMSQIMNNGYTRIPVYDGERTNIVALLNVKDLAFVDPTERIALKAVCKFYNRQVHFVFDDTRLNLLLEEFKKGHSHMAFVQKVVAENDKDPYYQTVGLVTLEDIIEEIIQSEILDETDVVTDNRSKRRRHNPRRKEFAIFNQTAESYNKTPLPPQLALATLQFLTTSVEPFKEELISTSVLKKLLKQDIFITYKFEEMSIDNLIYIAGKPADYFVMILQGRCLVEVGKDCMTFEGGPFTFFGCQALLTGGGRESSTRASALCLSDLSYSKHHTYVPDFTVKAVDDVQYIKVKRAQYISAVQATLLEREPKTTPRGGGGGGSNGPSAAAATSLNGQARDSPHADRQLGAVALPVTSEAALLSGGAPAADSDGEQHRGDPEEDDDRLGATEWHHSLDEGEDGKDGVLGAGRGGVGRPPLRRRFYSHRNYSSGNLIDGCAHPSASFVTTLDGFPLVPHYKQVTFPRRTGRSPLPDRTSAEVVPLLLLPRAAAPEHSTASAAAAAASSEGGSAVAGASLPQGYATAAVAAVREDYSEAVALLDPALLPHSRTDGSC